MSEIAVPAAVESERPERVPLREGTVKEERTIQILLAGREHCERLLTSLCHSQLSDDLFFQTAIAECVQCSIDEAEQGATLDKIFLF